MPEYRKVLCLENGNVYNGYSEAAKDLELLPQSVYKCCVCETIQTHGLHFCYEDEKDIYEVRVSKRGKPVVAIDLTTNEIKRFETSKAAASVLSLRPETICRILKGKTKTPRIGYSFVYAG